MGGMISAIEVEEKQLRMNEERNEIFEYITNIDDIKSEEGLQTLKYQTERFEKTFVPDSDDEDGISDKDVVFTKLPWDNIEQTEKKEQCERFCKALAKKDDLLMKLEGQLEYRFDFSLDKYAFMAVVMSKICRNLDETRLTLVPDEVSENEFWRNYFYQIELWKKEQGYESKLGAQIDAGEREQALAQEVQRAEREIEILCQDQLL